MLYNPKIVKGLRILVSSELDYDKYYIQYEFTGDNWKQDAKMVLKGLLEKNNYHIQTAHPYICNDIEYDNELIWIYNDTIFYDDL